MKENLLVWVSILIILSNIYLLGTSRLGVMIRTIAFQGILLSILPLLLPGSGAASGHLFLISMLSVIIKGFFIPNYLHKIISDVKVKRELSPYVGYFSSVVFGLVVSYSSFYLLNKMPFYSLVVSPIHASTAMASVLIGTFLIATRKKVLAQIIGFLVFENAGFILGVSVASTQPLFIEMGILFDLIAGVVIMGTSMKLIHLHFDSISVDSLERLKR